MTNSAGGASTPTSPMYSNGRLTAAHRDRLQRILTKQEMSTTTTKQAFRAPQRGYSPSSRMQRQKSATRIHTPLAQVSHRVRSSQSQMRPATAALTTRRSTTSAARKASPNTQGRKSIRIRTRTGGEGSRLASVRSKGELPQKRANPKKTWETKGLLLDQVQRTMKMHAASKDSARGVTTQSTTLTREETPMTEPERNAHTSCFMRTRDNKYLPPGTPTIDDEEVSSLLNQKRLMEQEARSKLPDRSPTATLLYGCREESALSPDATPRPTRRMGERDAAKGVGGVNWISIVEHNQRLASHDDLRNEKMEKAVRQEFCKKLAQQRVECQDALRKEVEEREREKQRLSSMYQQWHKEDVEKEDQQRKRVQQIKLSFHQQLSSIEQRRRHENDKWKRRERRQVDALKASLADEQAKNEQKKAENRKKILQMATENNKKIDRRRAETMREATDEIRLQKAYAAQLERQEMQRHEAKAKIEERQTKNLANLLAATKSFKQQAEEDEHRAEREHREARERMERIDCEKRERHERNQRHTNAVILRQREEKEAVQLQERAEWRLYGDYLNKDAELYEEEQRYHDEAQRRKNLQQTEMLLEQVKLNEQRKLAERADMSENERLYNHSLLNDCKKSLHSQASHSQDGGLTTERMAKQVDKRSPFRWRTENRPRPF